MELQTLKEWLDDPENVGQGMLIRLQLSQGSQIGIVAGLYDELPHHRDFILAEGTVVHVDGKDPRDQIVHNGYTYFSLTRFGILKDYVGQQVRVIVSQRRNFRVELLAPEN